MKAYLNNGIIIEGTVAEIKEFLEGQYKNRLWVA